MKTIVVGIRMEGSPLRRIDALCEGTGETRAEIARRALLIGLPFVEAEHALKNIAVKAGQLRLGRPNAPA